MKTIKIIDLLNKRANGEEVPKKIKYQNIVYEYKDYMYCTENANYQDIEDYLFGKWNFNILNDEVEILEEEKKIPERLPKSVTDNVRSNKDMVLIVFTLNKIIDYLESKETGE